MTQLIEITDSPEAGQMPQLPVVFGTQNLEALYKQVEDEVNADVPDVETQEGRARIKSLAAKISSSKTAIDKPIRDHLRALKAIPKELEKNARESVQRFDALKESTLAPLKAAQDSQDSILARLVEIVTLCNDISCSSVTAHSMRSEAEAISADDFWPELKKKAKANIEAAMTITEVTIIKLEKEEAQAAELEKLRRETAERDQAERDRKIAEAAAESARQQAQQQAQAEREALERRAVEAKQREEAQRMTAERAQADAERAEQRRIQHEEAAKLAAIEAEKKAQENARIAALRAESEAKQRAADEQAEVERLAKAREADKEHRIKINRANLVVFVAAGFSEDESKKIITMIAKRELPDIRISY